MENLENDLLDLIIFDSPTFYVSDFQDKVFLHFTVEIVKFIHMKLIQFGCKNSLKDFFSTMNINDADESVFRFLHQRNKS